MRRKLRNASAVIRIANVTLASVERVMRCTGWNAGVANGHLVAIGEAAHRGEATRVKNLVAQFSAATQLQTAREKAAESLKPKAAKLRAIQSLLKLDGPEIAEAPPQEGGQN